MSDPNADDEARIHFTEADLHPHLRARMEQRGITLDEVEATLNEGEPALDTKPGTQGKVRVFPYNAAWEGRHYAQKEVSVYYKVVLEKVVLLTAKARYGSGFGEGRRT